jgi:hypothetical protein
MWEYIAGEDYFIRHRDTYVAEIFLQIFSRLQQGISLSHKSTKQERIIFQTRGMHHDI